MSWRSAPRTRSWRVAGAAYAALLGAELYSATCVERVRNGQEWTGEELHLCTNVFLCVCCKFLSVYVCECVSVCVHVCVCV